MSKIINGVASEYDIPPNEKIVNGYYQTNIKTSRNEDSVYAIRYASQQILIDKLQQRIDKAIEYIDEMCLCSSGYFDYGDDLSPKHIVDILRGGENNR